MFNFLIDYIPLVNGVYYVILGMLFFSINLYIFDKLTPFNLKVDILNTQSKALGYIVRGQILGQAIMIGTLIYFLGNTYTIETFYFERILKDTINMIYFGIIGIVLFQLVINIISRKIDLYREIILEENESLGMIIGGLLISMSIIISLALYSY